MVRICQAYPSRPYLTCVVLTGLLAVLLQGCSGAGPGMSTVSGTVKMSGEPVGPGTVAFVPTGAGNPATGNVDDFGKFTMSTNKPGDGVPPGTYKVAVTIIKTPAHGDEKGNLFPATYLTPEKYMNAETSGLTVTVDAGKSQTVDFDLKP